MQRVGQNDSLPGFAHLLYRRQNRLAIRFESCFFAVMLQIHSKLIDSEFFELSQSTNVLVSITQYAKAIDDLVWNKCGVAVARTTVFVVVITLSFLDVIG